MPLNKRSDVVVDQSIELVARTNEPSEEAIVNLVQKQEEEELEDYKDGGFWGWATVVSSFLLNVAGLGYANAFGVYQDFYVREYLTTYTSSQISWIGSTQTFLLQTVGLIAGPLFDSGYCYHLVAAGSFIFVISLLFLSFAQPEKFYQVFLAQGLGIGIGSSLCYLPSLAIHAHHFRQPHARARAMGITVSGSSLGGILHPIMLNYLFNNESSLSTKARFAKGVRASAGFVAGLHILALVLLRTKYPKRVRARLDNTEQGRVHDNSEDKEDHERKPIEISVMIKKFIVDKPYVCFVFGMTLYETVFFFPSFYLQLDAITKGLDFTFAFYSLSILYGFSFIGRLVPGFLTRLLGVANMFVISTIGATILIFCMIAARTVSGVVTFAAFYGLFSGGFATLISPMLVLLSESPAELGARIGVCFTLTGLGSLFGPPIAGALLTSKYLWWRPIIFSGSLCIIGCMAFTAVRIILGKRMNGSFWII